MRGEAVAEALGVGVLVAGNKRKVATFSSLLRLMGLLLLISSLLLCLDSDLFLFDLLAHFRIQLTALSLILLLLFVLRRDMPFVLMSFVALLLNGFAIAPYLVASDSAVEVSRNHLRVMVANVNRSNVSYSKVRDVFREESPDILLVLELTQIWDRELEQMADAYPYRLISPSADNFGIGLYSRYELLEPSVRNFPEHLPVSITTTIRLAGRNISFIGTHPVPPIDTEFFKQRNLQLDLLAEYAGAEADPLILLGDLNTTMWSAAYRRFVAGSRLLNARYFAGLLPTWPAQFPVLMIPIDHCLVSKEWRVIEGHTVKIPGSDHRALVVELEILDRRQYGSFAEFSLY